MSDATISYMIIALVAEHLVANIGYFKWIYRSYN